MKMGLLSKLTSVLIILVVCGTASTLGISTGKSLEHADIKGREETVKEVLPSPTPSPSTSTTSAFTPSASDDTEFSSRLGSTNATTPTNKKELLSTTSKKPIPKYKSRNKKSPAATAASFKSSQVTYPENESGRNSPAEESEGSPHQNEPQSDVQLELLDDKGRTDPRDSEERGKYPRVYYGEANPQHPSYVSAEEEDGPLGKSHESDENGDHNSKYFYPKSYVQNKHTHKRSKNKKKYEYKYAEDVSRLEDPYQLRQSHNNGGGGREEPQQAPDPQYNGPEDYLGKENADGLEQGGPGGSPDNYGYGPQNHGGGGGPAHYGYHGYSIVAM